jgi:hypothetical protein
MKLLAIKTQDGYYLTDADRWGQDAEWFCKYAYFNGVHPEPTFHDKWVFVKTLPIKLEQEKSQQNINYRYELIDKSMMSEKVKDVFAMEEVANYSNGERFWKEEYKHLQSLYKLESDAQPNIMEPIEFTIETIYEVDKIDAPETFGWMLHGEAFDRDPRVLSQSNIHNQVLDKIIFPPLVLPSKPCNMSSKDSYRLIRQYVKDNINPRYAEITSDYDFCFTVKKRISLSEPETYTVDTNNSIFDKRKRKPKYETRYRKARYIEVFQMTHSEANYQGYSAIKGFIGKSQQELKENIDTYLHGLMEHINEPLADCPHCNGAGVIREANK